MDRVLPPVWESGGLGPETPLPSPRGQEAEEGVRGVEGVLMALWVR